VPERVRTRARAASSRGSVPGAMARARGGDRLHRLRLARRAGGRLLDQLADPSLRGARDRLRLAVLVEDHDTRPMVDRGVRRDRLRQESAAQTGGDQGCQRDQRLHLGLGEPGLVCGAQERRGPPVDAVGDQRDAQLVAETKSLVGPVPGRARQLTVRVDAGSPGDPTAVGEEGPLVDVLDDVLVVSQPRPGASDVPVDATGEQNRPWVDRVVAVALERDDGFEYVGDGGSVVNPRQSVRGQSLDVIADSGYQRSSHIGRVRRAERAGAPPEFWDGGHAHPLLTLRT
jgi:hypothetical protein